VEAESLYKTNIEWGEKDNAGNPACPPSQK